MAFRDIEQIMYDGTIKLSYKDKAHRYYVWPRVDFDLPEDHKLAWGKLVYPSGTTTLLGDTLEKKGLLTWPMGVALGELFGFYDFNVKDELTGKVERKTGFKQNTGTLWLGGAAASPMGRVVGPWDEGLMLPKVLSAAQNYQRRQKKGADIGSVVHDAIEHYIKDLPFDIKQSYTERIHESDYTTEKDREDALTAIDADVEKAELAFARFTAWWDDVQPTLHGAEDILYSKQYNVCGTYDGDISIPRSHHPIYGDKPLMRWNPMRTQLGMGRKLVEMPADEPVRVVADWKTSNASLSEDAAMLEGINYQYYIQSAIYELIRREMGMEPADDLLIVSCRKDGGFTPLFASELGLSIEDCLNWAKCVIECHRLAKLTKAALNKHAEGTVL